MKQKSYKQILNNAEILLLCKYINQKIKDFKKYLKELMSDVSKVSTGDERKELIGLIHEYKSDILYYERLKEKLMTDSSVSFPDALELWCMADNKEQYDKIHNDLHLSIVKKLKEYNEKLSSKKTK